MINPIVYPNNVRQLVTHQTDHQGIKPDVVLFYGGSCSRQLSKGRFTLTRTFARIVRANSSRRSLCQMQFARTTCEWRQFSTNILHTVLITAGRKLYLKSKQYAGLKNVLTWIFAISLCIPSQIDARQPAIRWLSLGDILISVFV